MDFEEKDDKEQYVYKILLMPIDVVTRKKMVPYIENNRIKTSEIYIPKNSRANSSLDEDMSDIAVMFYECVYSLALLEDRRPITQSFLGDTMISSYKEEIENYHCLANFWILPELIGRSIRSTFSRGRYRGLNDKMDLFLENLEVRWDEYNREFEEYFEKFKKDEFYDKHFLNGSYVKNKSIKKIGSADDAKKIIEDRARTIACKKKEELFDLFSNILTVQYLGEASQCG